jgi:predicted phosphodiesterase
LEPSHDDLRACWSNTRIIVYGHTHKQVWDKETIPWIVNPGAAGETRTRGGASCAILTASKENWSIELKRFPNEDIKVA